MRGQTPTLKDIVLESVPEVGYADEVDLYCYESMPTDEEMEAEQPQPLQAPRAAYKIESECGVCEQKIRLFVACSRSAIYSLYQLLFEDLDIVCPQCAVRPPQ
ncbi:E7 protein [Tree shrew papillomavirus 2]|uniref:Protein E7 n=1 Tax=Tree shrew papillomavirus 2 TaxID=2562516 RepID=A0AAF1D2G7_9PAPI|nr:E7 protein [Tree shrew papillomavirus 2]